MDKKMIARELLGMAKELVGMEFPTQEALDKYLKDHPDADRSNHKVEKTEKKEPMTREKAKGMLDTMLKYKENKKRVESVGKKIDSIAEDLGMKGGADKADVVNGLSKYFKEHGKSEGQKLMKKHQLTMDDMKFLSKGGRE